MKTTTIFAIVCFALVAGLVLGSVVTINITKQEECEECPECPECPDNDTNMTPDPNTIYCAKLIITNESNASLNCTNIIIAPEYYNNTVECQSITVTDRWIFWFEGKDYTYQEE